MYMLHFLHLIAIMANYKKIILQRGILVKSYTNDNVSDDNKKYLPKIDLKYDCLRNKYNMTLFQHPKQNELTSEDVGDTKSQLPTSK